jgi:hypothetical protein
MYQLTDKEIYSFVLVAVIALPYLYFLVRERKNVKSNYYEVSTSSGFNMLSKNERKLYSILNEVGGENVTQLGIQKVCADGTVYQFRKMIIALKEQGSGNPGLLIRIIGEEAFEAVMTIKV